METTNNILEQKMCTAGKIVIIILAGIIFIAYCLCSEYVSTFVEIRCNYTRRHSFHNKKSDKSIKKNYINKMGKVYFEECTCI
jgi:hypothetical protein